MKILVWEGYDSEQAFEKLDRIEIEAAYLAQNEDTITKTQADGSFDALTIYQGMVDPLIQTGRIVPIDTGLLSNYPHLMSIFRDSEALTRDGDVFGVPYVWGTMMLAYDAARTDRPRTFEDLLSPQLAGKIAIPDDAYAVLTTFARFAGFQDANRLTSPQLDEVFSLLERIRPQLLTIAGNYGELPAMYQRGEILVSLPDWTPTVLAATERDVQTTILEEGAFSFVDSWMVVHDSDNLAASYAMIDEAIGVTAQTVMSSAVGLGIVNEEAVNGLDPDLAAAWNYEDLEANYAQAPLYAGVPIEPDGDVVAFQEWIDRWSKFKSA
ncbi:MAG: extracellular solute-binding protein [Ilumatobacteraceae bacterium]|nr:extracellular solute-binding protein [Ilumatobacteraceae bacterium]